MTTKKETTSRPQEIVESYLFELENHLAELKAGKAESTFGINDLAKLLHIHPTHLSNTIHEKLGKSPCVIYEEKLINIAKELLLSSQETISSIAHTLTFDPSNFTKFFKSYEGITPKQFRQKNNKY